MYYFLRLIARLPLCILQLMASWVAFFLSSYDSSFKRISEINLKLAYPDLTQLQQQALLKASLKSQCSTYFEFLKCWGMPAEYSLSLLKNFHGEQHFHDAIANQKGIIVVVLHFGCWELLNAWLNLYSEPVIMYKPNKHPAINRYILASRENFNAKLVETDEHGVRAIFKHLKQGGLTVILPDHLPKASGGLYSELFGQPALSSTLVSKLAAKTQCNVIGLSCIRNPDGSSFDVHCRPLSDEILSRDTQHSLDSLNREIESMISLAPEQYLWSYKRFRNLKDQKNPYNKEN